MVSVKYEKIKVLKMSDKNIKGVRFK